MDGLSVDEGDGEALGGEFHGEVDEWVDVALVWVWDHDGVRLLMMMMRGRHCCLLHLEFGYAVERKLGMYV